MNAPKYVERQIKLNSNQLASLQHFPQFNNIMIINISNNKITSLAGITGRSVVAFNCSNNPLSSVQGIKVQLIKNLDAHQCKLNTLIGMPRIQNDILLQGNDLTTLNGIQLNVNGLLNISSNDITDFTGFPEKISKIQSSSSIVKKFVQDHGI